MRKRELTVLLLNSVLVLFCVLGLIFASKEIKNIFLYYTEDSNILSGISSLLLVIFLIVKKDLRRIPDWVYVFRYIGTCCLTVTFIVVVTILIPSDNINYLEGVKRFLFQGSMLFHHLLCPIISFISFTLFEGNKKLNKKKTIWYALIPTFIYGVIFIMLNIFRIVDGPYPFLRVYKQPWYMSIMWIFIIYIGNYYIAKLILYLNQLSANRECK